MKRLAALGLVLLVLVGCAAQPAEINLQQGAPEAQPGQSAPYLPDDIASKQIIISGDGLETRLSFSFSELAELPGACFEGVYSAINNWPTARLCVARGIKLSAVLKAAGVLESAQTITIRSEDGYAQSFTKAQLLGERFLFPGVAQADDSSAEPVETILAFAYAEQSEDISAAEFTDPMLVLGQANIFEHNNPAFVEQVAEIEIQTAPPGRWEEATTFPASGKIAAGEKVKLQHKDFGRVKLHYTTDGSLPDERSPMYNPSTYQPELNLPIEINENTTIRVIAVGYGRENSEVSTFEFTTGE
jgi:hypothetical protein